MDLTSRTIVQRVPFPADSKPFMLRVSPDNQRVWVQTSGTNMNFVLDAATMDVLNAVPVGVDPEQSAFQPNGGPYGLIAHLSSTALFVLDSTTGDEVERIDFGTNQANICFTPDAATAFVTSPDADEVVVIDMATLAISARIPTGGAPSGIVLIDLPTYQATDRSC